MSARMPSCYAITPGWNARCLHCPGSAWCCLHGHSHSTCSVLQACAVRQSNTWSKHKEKIPRQSEVHSAPCIVSGLLWLVALLSRSKLYRTALLTYLMLGLAS